jgi:hypothetical protein
MVSHPSRRTSAVLGRVFLVVVAGAIGSLGGEVLDSPVLAGQVTLLGAAGLCDIVAGRENSLTEQFAWYRWSGLGNVFLGLTLPLGFLGFDAGLVLSCALALGGLSLVLMGADMLVFDGRYLRGEPFDSATA